MMDFLPSLQVNPDEHQHFNLGAFNLRDLNAVTHLICDFILELSELITSQ